MYSLLITDNNYDFTFLSHCIHLLHFLFFLTLWLTLVNYWPCSCYLTMSWTAAMAFESSRSLSIPFPTIKHIPCSNINDFSIKCISNIKIPTKSIWRLGYTNIKNVFIIVNFTRIFYTTFRVRTTCNWTSYSLNPCTFFDWLDKIKQLEYA